MHRMVALLLSVAAIALQAMEAQQPDAPSCSSSIGYAEVGRSAAIVGRLGLPLGTAVTVRGTWIGDARADDLRFHVTSVNGRPVSQGIAFRHVALTNEWLPLIARSPAKERLPARGDKWELRGWETGRFQGAPQSLIDESSANVEESGLDIPLKKGAYAPFRLETQFLYCEQIDL